jgi:hypothetical protein
MHVAKTRILQRKRERMKWTRVCFAMRKFQKCTKFHEELPKMHKFIWGTSKNAHNPTRNFQICTNSHEELPKMYKIPWLTSNNAQNPMRNFQNVHNPMRNSQICTILRGTSKNAQNPTRNIQNCTKSHEELPKMLKITWGTSKIHKIP